MPLKPSTLRRLSSRFARKKIYDVSDALAISAACATRGDIFGRETWLDFATERLVAHGMKIPAVISTTEMRDLAAA